MASASEDNTFGCSFESKFQAEIDCESEGGKPPTLRTFDEPPNNRHAVRRKEVEARRYSGKEDVCEYLLQFELTARRNGWDDDEKSVSLLCALDGQARGILSEFDDPTNATFDQVKQALLRRFGPTQLVEVYEQSLTQLRLGKNQNIRELAQEVQRLVKLAYPDIFGPPRERLAVKHLINAVTDKEAVFYVREKNPANIMEACTLYERYMALTSESDHAGRRSGIRGVSDAPPPRTEASDLQSQVTEAIERMSAATAQQLKRLSDAMDNLKSAASQQPALVQPSSQPRTVVAPPPPPSVPRKPCPRCGQAGHWARDCNQTPQQPPLTGGCYRCGQPGHLARECKTPLNYPGPMSAPTVGPRPTLYQ